jgi:hypothetical protein
MAPAHAQPAEGAPEKLRLTTGQRSQWNSMQGLLRRFSEATDRGTREQLAHEFLSGTKSFREVFPPEHEYWRARARMALVVEDDRAGREAADMLAKIKTPDAATISLLSRLAQRGWRQDGSEKGRMGGDFVMRVLELQMIYLPPGSYIMGSTAFPNEGPPTKVTITHPFWIAKHEITRRHWRAVMGSDLNDAQEPALPKVGISWWDAMEFCQKLTVFEQVAGRIPYGYAYTLPTEAQWEYACRAGGKGDEIGELDKMAWHGSNSDGRLHAVGGKLPNAWGISNMLGNASEWCLDYYVDNLPGGEVTDPVGPPDGTLRAVRGGNFTSSPANCRPAKRGRAFADDETGASDKIGLRIVLTRKSKI